MMRSVVTALVAVPANARVYRVTHKGFRYKTKETLRSEKNKASDKRKP